MATMPASGSPLAMMTTIASPWGPVHVAASAAGVCGVQLLGSAAAFADGVGRRIGGTVTGVGGDVPRGTADGLSGADERLAQVRAELLLALDGRPSGVQDVPLDWRGIPAWDRRVLEGARGVARGEATSYGRLARRIGAPGAARAVGAALGRNPFWILVPCHRVVAGDGSIGGYGGGLESLELKRDLLALEGTTVPVARLLD
jgi:methylated-DNA-[protein]-cysteine S-methyltransferase